MTTAARTGPLPGLPEVRVQPSTVRRWVWLVALVVVVAALAAYRRHRQRTRTPQATYETEAVTQGTIAAKITATGTLSPLVTVQVGSQVSGRIAQLLVDFNSPVKKGEVIARIDPMLFEAAVQQARANDGAARANVAKAKAQAVDADRQARRMRALRRQHLVAQADLDTARTNADVAHAQVTASEAALEQAAAGLHQAQINLDYTTIVSPIDGVVISRNVDVGQTVAASFQSPVLFVLAQDLKQMQVDSSVAEADVGRLQPGMTASFTVDAYPSQTFTGTIRQIRNAAQTVQNVVTYDAVIDVANPDLELKPGMTANITVVYAERKDAVRVPSSALRFRPPPEWLGAKPGGRAPMPVQLGDRRTVWLLKAGKPEAVSIRVGVSDGTSSELVQGDLHPGDRLVTEVLAQRKSGPGSFGRVL